ncbi:hypothetical protein RJZ57_006631 [Blastomyces gilchristii]
MSRNQSNRQTNMERSKSIEDLRRLLQEEQRARQKAEGEKRKAEERAVRAELITQYRIKRHAKHSISL